MQVKTTPAEAENEQCEFVLECSEFEKQEEFFDELESELELELDPLKHDPLSELGPEWEAAIRAIQVRKVVVSAAEEQMANIRKVLNMLEAETEEPSAD